MSLLSTTCSGRMIAAIAVASILLVAPSAHATHEIDHRFTVWGEIKYEDGTAASEVAVSLLVKGGESMGDVSTDDRGRYRFLLHVHNEDLYKVFDMRVNNVTRKVRLLFNPNDRQTERGQRIDLVVKREGQYETSAVPTR